MAADDEVESLLADHTDDVAAVARRVRALLLADRPDLTERVRPGWHSVNYALPGAGFVCTIIPLADRVRLGFVFGALLPDPEGRLIGTGRQIRYLEFADEAAVDPAVILEFLDLTVELRAGLRRPRP